MPNQNRALKSANEENLKRKLRYILKNNYYNIRDCLPSGDFPSSTYQIISSRVKSKCEVCMNTIEDC
jgi:hypothetical protein